jgi:hypothetical protein
MEDTWIGFWSLNGKVHQSLYVLFSYFEKESVDDWGSRRGIRRYKEPIPNRCPPPNFGLLFSSPFLIFIYHKEVVAFS